MDLARAYLDLAYRQSCGQCFPCRLGTERLMRIMERVCSGRGGRADLDQIAATVQRVSDSARCGVGRNLAKPVLDLMENFPGDFLDVAQGRRPVRPGRYQSVVTAPCTSACPSHVDVPGYLEGIRLGRDQQALDLVRRDCPMPGSIGRVCVRPCEAHCRRGLLDEPLAIRSLKRFLADGEMDSGRVPDPAPAPERAKKVAVVGAGPAGLACAYYLGKQGYKTTVFEAQEGPGGMAAFGIPAYRLPREVLAHEAAMVERAGAEIRYGVKVGEDITLEQMSAQGYGAIYLGVGAPESARMRCEGEEAGYRCFMTGVDFLARVARGERPIEGDRLVVVGGGNVAMDCVRSARRLGFNEVNLLYRRTEAEMPADPQEVREAREEGVRFHYLVAPRRIISHNGRVSGLVCLRMELGEPDQSGRRRPVPVEGSEFVIDCDAIVPAVGQICVVDCVLPDSDGLTPWHTLVVNRLTFQSGQQNIFGGGDCVTGPDTLIAALNAGKKAAGFIAQYLEKGSCSPSAADVLERLLDPGIVYDPEEEFPFPGGSLREEPAVLAPEERITGFEEVEGGFTSVQARREAARCLRCYRLAVAAY